MESRQNTHPYYPRESNIGSLSTLMYNKRSSISSMHSDSFSSRSDPTSESIPSMGEQADSPRKSSKKGVSSFISKLYSMIEDARHLNLISWNPSGTSFFVYNATQFSQEVLPEHFKHSNFSSFVRLLNMYGFHKINKSPRGQRGNNENELWEFSHMKFQRGRPNLLKDIKRKAMDAELLRRETGDIHASFSVLQASQADLLQQFNSLQENFSSLLKTFEESKKVQAQQQYFIEHLAERLGMTHDELLQLQNSTVYEEANNFDTLRRNSSVPDENAEGTLNVYVTSPNHQNPYHPMHFDGRLHPLQTTPENSISVYDTSSSPSPSSISPNMFNTSISTNIMPPSPISSCLRPSHLNHLNHNSYYQSVNYKGDNALGLNLS